jgi:hypothetical protein
LSVNVEGYWYLSARKRVWRAHGKEYVPDQSQHVGDIAREKIRNGFNASISHAAGTTSNLTGQVIETVVGPRTENTPNVMIACIDSFGVPEPIVDNLDEKTASKSRHPHEKRAKVNDIILAVFLDQLP